MSEEVEYRVRPVTRYVVTRFYRYSSGGLSGGGCDGMGEFDNSETAYAVGYALAKQEHNRLGYPPEDMRIKYPGPIEHEARPVTPA